MAKKQVKVEYDAPNVDFEKEQRLEEMWGLIPTVSAVPTWTPKRFIEQFAIYKSGATRRFYWYDNENNEWVYAGGTV